jgi:branched-chain amino acid transport system substrate-binding protein
MICSCTGPFGINIAAAGNVARSWANYENGKGGISGHPVNLIVEDDASTPGTSVSALQTLISDHVDVILDLTVLDAAWASTASAANIPVVGGNFSSTPFYTNPDFYPSGQTNDSIAYSVAATAKAAGGSNLAQLYCAEAPQCAQSVPLIKSSANKLGLKDVYDASIAATAPNYTAQCVASQQAHVNAMFIGHSAFVVAKVGSDCLTQGVKPAYVTEGTGFSSLVATGKGISENLWSEFPILPYYSDQAPVQTMNTQLDKDYPGLRQNAASWSEYAAQAWTGGLLIEHGIKAGGLTASGTPSAAEVKQGLDSINGDNLDGWSPSLTFTAGKPHSVDCWFTGRVQNGGTPALVNGGQLTCQTGA